MNFLHIYWSGLFMGASLIIAIGAQNAFVLTHSIRRIHALPVAALCALLDVLLISAGVCGVGTLVAESPILRALTTFGGAAFLIWFGARSLLAARNTHTLQTGDTAVVGLKKTLTATLAISLLNPHVYLDTVVMLGAISGNYPGNGRYMFGAGAATASVIWFFSLYFAGRLLAPVFTNPKAWQVLHVAVGIMVLWVAAGLVYTYFI